MSRMLPSRVLDSGHIERTGFVTELGAVWDRTFVAEAIPESSAASLPCVITVPSDISMVAAMADADASDATATQTA